MTKISVARQELLRDARLGPALRGMRRREGWLVDGPEIEEASDRVPVGHVAWETRSSIDGVLPFLRPETFLVVAGASTDPDRFMSNPVLHARMAHWEYLGLLQRVFSAEIYQLALRALRCSAAKGL